MISLLRSHRRTLRWALHPGDEARAAAALVRRGEYPSPIRVHAEAARLRRVRGWWLAVGVVIAGLASL